MWVSMCVGVGVSVGVSVGVGGVVFGRNLSLSCRALLLHRNRCFVESCLQARAVLLRALQPTRIRCLLLHTRIPWAGRLLAPHRQLSVWVCLVGVFGWCATAAFTSVVVCPGRSTSTGGGTATKAASAAEYLRSATEMTDDLKSG